MKLINALGLLLVSIPFIALFVFISKVENGEVKVALGIFGACVVIVGIIGLGTYLLTKS